MAYAQLLTDTCNIFHLQIAAQPGLYGLPDVSTYKYNDAADSVGVACYFAPSGLRPNMSAVGQGPSSTVSESYLVHFLPSVDVRLNDRIQWNGAMYIAQQPRKIRNHHIEVTVHREVSL